VALRLGEALVQEGLIDNQQLSKALERQVIYGGRLGTNLIELGLLTEESLVRFMGKVFGVPYADPKAFEGIKRGIVDSIAPEIAERYLVIPIDREPKRLHLAMVNPTDLRVVDEVRFITGYEIVPYIASELRILYALERYFGIQRPLRFISVISDVRGEPPQIFTPRKGAIRKDGRTPQRDDQTLGTAEDIGQSLVNAEDREEIARVILDCASSNLKRVVLFVVKSNMAVGWMGFGGQLTEERISLLELPLDQPSIFRTVIDGREFYQGPIPPIPLNVHLLEMMGGESPREVILFPLVIKGRVACLLYGDSGDKSLLIGDYEELKRIMIKSSMALEMLILRKKILEM